MDREKFGVLLREIRESRGFTRKQLAEGLCTPTYIYNIERGQYYPSSIILSGLSRKLSYDFYEGMEYTIYEKPDNVKIIKKELEEAYISGNYKGLSMLLDKCEKDSDLDNPMDQQLLFWYKGIIERAVNKNFDISREILLKAINLTALNFSLDHFKGTFLTKLELKIMSSYAVTYYYQGNSKKILSLYKLLLQTYLKYYNNSYELVEYLYNYCYLLYKNKSYKRSYNLVCHIEKKLADISDLHLIADVYHLKGRILFELGQNAESHHAFKDFVTFKKIAESDKEKLHMYKTTIKAKYGFEV